MASLASRNLCTVMPTSLTSRLRGHTSRAGAEDFDEIYLAERRPLLLQAFAVTGDLAAATAAVRDGFISARHHWAKVGRLEDPMEWIRPRAWVGAQRRHSARPWHKEKTLGPEQVEVLEALHELPDLDRKLLVLDVLARVPLTQAAREVGLPRERAERLLAMAKAGTAVTLGIPAEHLERRLSSLDTALTAARLPRPAMIRRNGVQRRRTHAFVAAVVLVALTLVSGAFVLGRPGDVPQDLGPLVPRSMLLDPPAVAQLDPKAIWTQVSTTDNTQGSGIHSQCQTSAFADTRGVGTWVRQFSAAAKPQRVVTQTVEISASPGGARSAYDTTVGWFAGCSVARLLDAYTVTGVGNQAQALLLHVPGKPTRNYLVGVARTGSLTVSTLVETRAGRAPGPRMLLSVLAAAVQGVCESRVADLCVEQPAIVPVLPPPSGEGEGLLAVADLPPLPGVRRPWVGTKPEPAIGPIASTTCDRTDFARRGALGPSTRTFLIPQLKLPPRFGITETIGRFPQERQARQLVSRVTRQLGGCEDRQLSTQVTAEHVEPRSFRGSEFALWRVENELNDERVVVFWMGIARAGNYVAQVQFAPVEGRDVDEETFRALVTRARDRLFELLPEPPAPSPAPPASPTPAG